MDIYSGSGLAASSRQYWEVLVARSMLIISLVAYNDAFPEKMELSQP